MRLIGIVAVSLLLALGAVALSAPVALAGEPSNEFPQYASCVKAAKETVQWTERSKSKRKTVYTGAWENPECTTPDTTDSYRGKGAHPGPEGRYERVEVSSEGYEAAAKPVTLTTESTKGVAESIVCKLAVSRGEFLESDVHASDSLTFEGCIANDEKKNDPCETIETEPLFTTLVWLNRAETEPGILIEGEHEQIASFKCGPEESTTKEQVELKGYLVGVIANTKKGHSISFALSVDGQQAQRSVWLFGSEVDSLGLYTQLGSRRVESTLQALEEQPGTDVY